MVLEALVESGCDAVVRPRKEKVGGSIELGMGPGPTLDCSLPCICRRNDRSEWVKSRMDRGKGDGACRPSAQKVCAPPTTS